MEVEFRQRGIAPTASGTCGMAQALVVLSQVVEAPDGLAANGLESEPEPDSAAALAGPSLDEIGIDHRATMVVAENLPPFPAICDAELDAIERYMSDILDAVLGGGVGATTAS